MNLIELTKKKVLEECVEAVKPASGWKVMVVDHDAMKVISAVCKMYDIVEQGVTVVEKLELARQPMPRMEAIYFITPTPKSVKAVVADFAGEQPLYAAAHLFFTEHLGDSVFELIAQCAPLKARVKTCTELYVDFLAVEQRVFHFERPNALVSLFSPESALLKAEQSTIVAKLASLCATLGEQPLVRYSKRHPLAGALAGQLAERLATLARADNGPLADARSGAERATLLLLDRTEDVVAPLLHEFTYQAMVYDLLGVPPHGTAHDQYKYEFKSSKTGGTAAKTVLLNDADAVWCTLRHQHIAEAINWVIGELNEFLKNNKAANFKKHEVKSVAEMSDALRAMPEYKEMLAKYELHVSIADACMSHFNGQSLTDIATVEQGLATGQDADGKTFKNAITQLSPLLADDSISADNKLRLLAIFLISQEGVEEKTRKKLMQTAQLDDSAQAALANLTYLGVSLKKASLKSKILKSKGKKKKKTTAGIEDDIPYELSRFQPAVRDLIVELADDELSEAAYPVMSADGDSVAAGKSTKGKKGKAGTSLRSGAKPKWAKKKAGAKDDSDEQYSGSRIIIFVAGGITHSEIRTVYELSQKLKRDIIIGGTHILTPDDFVKSLKEMRSGNNDDDDDSDEESSE